MPLNPLAPDLFSPARARLSGKACLSLPVRTCVRASLHRCKLEQPGAERENKEFQRFTFALSTALYCTAHKTAERGERGKRKDGRKHSRRGTFLLLIIITLVLPEKATCKIKKNILVIEKEEEEEEQRIWREKSLETLAAGRSLPSSFVCESFLRQTLCMIVICTCVLFFKISLSFSSDGIFSSLSSREYSVYSLSIASQG